MIVSRCCKEEVFVGNSESSDNFYVCYSCNLPCGTMMSLNIDTDDEYDSRIYDEVEKVIDFAGRI